MISVILPFHLNENQRYLDLCTESLRRQTTDFEVIVVSSSEAPPAIPQDPRFKLVHFTEKSQYAKKINKGIRLSNQNSKYLMLASDDVIFGANSLQNLASICGDHKMILNAYSNCDLGFHYFGHIDVGPLALKKFMDYEEVIGKEEHLYNYGVGLNLTIPTPQNCFYATMIPRKVWEEVGELDENYKTGWEDTDYCLRAKQKTIGTFTTLTVFIFHFGGKTSGSTVTEDEKRHNEKYFQERWEK